MKIFKQLAVLFGVCLVGEWISGLLPFPFPASVVAMVLLLALLLTGVVKSRSIDTVADFLLKHITILFIPAASGIINSMDLLRGRAFQLFVICLVTTFLVFAAAAWTVQLVMALQTRLGKGRRNG